MAKEEHEYQLWQLNWHRNVFICFRDVNARMAFPGHLRDSLNRKGFKVSMDDSGLGGADYISLSLLKVLERTRIAVVVLSQDFATSAYHLGELVEILECKKTINQLVLPIFYKVDPSEVRHLTGRYGEAMSEHERMFGSRKLQKWKSALSEIANLQGLHFDGRDELELELARRTVERVDSTLPRYDVFLSFCGEDTRYSFTGFLYHALRREGLKTFMDDVGLVCGSLISESLLEAIERSKLSIVVFSENYGYSSWCLDELVKITECMTENQLVLPIYYKIEQSEVRDQTKRYDDAMTAHENRFGNDSEMVQKWRSALSEVASLEGEHIEEDEFEYEIIQKIVEKAKNDVGNLLYRMSIVN